MTEEVKIKPVGKVIAVASGKGGVGKSVISANLGIALAKFGKRVLLVDDDLCMPNLAIFLGLKNAPVAFYDILTKTRGKPLDQAIYIMYGKVDFIPCSASLDEHLKVDLRVLKKVIIRLKDRYDIILMDTASGLNKYSLSAMRVADEVLWVTTPDEPSIADVRRLKIMADRFDTKTRGVIVNRIPKFSFLEIKGLPIIRKSEVEQRLGTKVVGAIPEDKDIYKAALVQKPLLEYKPKGSAAKAFRLCARNLLLQK